MGPRTVGDVHQADRLDRSARGGCVVWQVAAVVRLNGVHDDPVLGSEDLRQTFVRWGESPRDLRPQGEGFAAARLFPGFNPDGPKQCER